jgi:hypothetical protein
MYITMDKSEVTPLGPCYLCSAYSTLRRGVICSSEKSVDFQRTTRRYIAEGSTLLSEEVLELWTGANCVRAITDDGLL